eukprot:4460604-Prymnesium_polylepis.1
MSSDASVAPSASPAGLGKSCTRAERLRRASGRKASRSTDRPRSTSSLPPSHRCPDRLFGSAGSRCPSLTRSTFLLHDTDCLGCGRGRHRFDARCTLLTRAQSPHSSQLRKLRTRQDGLTVDSCRVTLFMWVPRLGTYRTLPE